MNQLRILAKLDPDNVEDYGRDREILQAGYAILYDQVFTDVFEEMPAEEGEYVFDVLQMHRVLIQSFNELTDKEGLTLNDVRFRGFDGNNETKRWAFAEYLQKRGLFQETLTGDVNSHNMTTLSRYRPMLKAWKMIHEQQGIGDWKLTAAQIRQIISRENG